MSSPYTPSIPRSTLPLPSRRGAGAGLKPQTQTIGGSVTSATSRQPAHHGQPDPGQIDAGLEEMLKGLEGLERDLVKVFDGVENAFDPSTNPGLTQLKYDQAIQTLKRLIEISMTTSLGGVPLIPGSSTSDVKDLSTIPRTTVPAATAMTSTTTATTTTASTATPSSAPTLTTRRPLPNLTQLSAQIGLASGETYSRGKVLADEVRGIGEVLSRR